MPRLAIIDLSSEEKQQALAIAEEISHQPTTNDPVAASHLGEAQVIQLALRPDYRNDILLLDELAARTVARQKGIKLSGFPGVLLLAVQTGLMSAEELRERLELCRQLGTHYGVSFVRQVYEMAKHRRN